MARFLSLIQQRLAANAVASAAASDMGPPGLASPALDFLGTLKFDEFVVPKRFNTALETTTQRLRLSFPQGSQFWGSARQYLNLFLRDVISSHQLCEAHELGPIEKLLELPLDAAFAARLQREKPGLPPWRGVPHLMPTENARYQAAAAALAASRSCPRVHLDVIVYFEALGDRAP